MIAEQLPLFGGLPTGQTKNEQAFLRFHAEHPEVYIALLKLAKQVKARGETRTSIKMLWEVLRWQSQLGNKDGGYKLPNQMHAYYARLLMARNPDLAGLSATRVQKG